MFEPAPLQLDMCCQALPPLAILQKLGLYTPLCCTFIKMLPMLAGNGTATHNAASISVSLVREVDNIDGWRPVRALDHAEPTTDATGTTTAPTTCNPHDLLTSCSGCEKGCSVSRNSSLHHNMDAAAAATTLTGGLGLHI